MDRLKERLLLARHALSTLKELMEVPATSVVRDAAIQRFEYTFEAMWKAAQRYLWEVEGMDAGSPKGVVRACFSSGVLNQDSTELALEMVDDRNLTVHTYNEAVADMIYKRLPDYAELMEKWLSAISRKLEKEQ